MASRASNAMAAMLSAMPLPHPSSQPASPTLLMRLDPALLPPNALLLDLRMQLLSCGAGAKALMAANAEVLGLLHGRLVILGQQPGLAGQLMSGQSLSLPRKDRSSLSVLAQVITDGDDQPLAVMATLVDPSTQRMDRRLLASLFGLTPTEARIAAALADGHSTHRIAGELGVQLNTVHAHVKNVLAKTHTQRQVQLVSLLWRSAVVTSAPQPSLPLSQLLPAPLLAGEALQRAAVAASTGNDPTPRANQTEAC